MDARAHSLALEGNPVHEDMLDALKFFNKANIFAIMTDGFYEWARADGELFGIDRVTEIIRACRKHSADEILRAIKSAVEDFADTAQADDLTAIIIKKID